LNFFFIKTRHNSQTDIGSKTVGTSRGSQTLCKVGAVCALAASFAFIAMIAAGAFAFMCAAGIADKVRA
jgi:hypothetical protein